MNFSFAAAALIFIWLTGRAHPPTWNAPLDKKFESLAENLILELSRDGAKSVNQQLSNLHRQRPTGMLFERQLSAVTSVSLFGRAKWWRAALKNRKCIFGCTLVPLGRPYRHLAERKLIIRVLRHLSDGIDGPQQFIIDSTWLLCLHFWRIVRAVEKRKRLIATRCC